MISSNFNSFSVGSKNLIYEFIFNFKTLLTYIFFGTISVAVELSLRKLIIQYGYNENFSSYLSLPFGIILAFYLNTKYNFKIKKKKLFISFILFTSISLISFFTQKMISQIYLGNLDYELKRLIVSGTCFIFFYFAHVKFSFKDKVKIGVAVYANGIEDINKIFQKINKYPDFIHVDLVDTTFNKNSLEINPNQIKLAKQVWKNKQIHMHIMSKYPSKWIDTYIHEVDKIFFHYEIFEDIEKLLKRYKKYENKVGMAVSCNTKFEKYKDLIIKFKNVLLLAIDVPGQSGQKFNSNAIETIKKINNHIGMNDTTLCVDGGINNSTIKLIDSDEIISGSYVLKNKDPIAAMLLLKFT